MLKPAGHALIYYGLFLFLMGLVAAFFDPTTGSIGFYAPAKTAIVSGSVAGGFSVLWGLLIAWRNWAWPLYAGLVTTLLFLAAFIWRAIAGWSEFFGGATEKWYAASIITIMAVMSLMVAGMLIRLVRLVRKLPKGPIKA